MQPKGVEASGCGFSFDLPPQSYLSYGPLTFKQEEICHDKALIAIEHDKGFQRVDAL